MADGWACAPDFARNPRRSCRPDADSSCPPARHAAWPNRVHSRLGLVFRLGLLSTCPRGHAVALGYLEVARCFKTQTFTGLFHKRISARTAVSHHSSLCARSAPTSPSPTKLSPQANVISNFSLPSERRTTMIRALGLAGMLMAILSCRDRDNASSKVRPDPGQGLAPAVPQPKHPTPESAVTTPATDEKLL